MGQLGASSRNTADLPPTILKVNMPWDFPGGPVVKTLSSNTEGANQIPGQGANIPHAFWSKKKTKKTET